MWRSLAHRAPKRTRTEQTGNRFRAQDYQDIVGIRLGLRDCGRITATERCGQRGGQRFCEVLFFERYRSEALPKSIVHEAHAAVTPVNGRTQQHQREGRPHRIKA